MKQKILIVKSGIPVLQGGEEVKSCPESSILNWSCAMTEFHLVPDEVHSSGAFALPRSPAGGPTGGLCHSTRFTSGPTAPSAFATSARRVLQVLPGLLDLTAYPNPMSILARSRAQPKHQEPPDGVLRVASPRPHIEAGESKPLRNAFFNRRGRSSSMTNFNAQRHSVRRRAAHF